MIIKRLLLSFGRCGAVTATLITRFLHGVHLLRAAEPQSRYAVTLASRPRRRCCKARLSLYALMCLSVLACQPAHEPAQAVPLGRVVTSDIANFWEAFDSLGAAESVEDSLQAIQTLYLDRGSPGLQEYVRSRVEDPAMLLFAIRAAPRYLASIRQQTLRVEDHASTVETSFNRLAQVYPEIAVPDVYFLYSGLISMGVSTDVGILIGADMVSADGETPRDELPEFLDGVDLTTDVIPCIVTHELVHFQQENEGGPRLLRISLMEGVADFVSDLAVGCHGSSEAVYNYGDENEADLWAEFKADLVDDGNIQGWLYNGGSSDRPANLGYWVGYQISEAYYDRSSNKEQAVRDMLVIRDSEAFLASSGYDGPA